MTHGMITLVCLGVNEHVEVRILHVERVNKPIQQLEIKWNP